MVGRLFPQLPVCPDRKLLSYGAGSLASGAGNRKAPLPAVQKPRGGAFCLGEKGGVLFRRWGNYSMGRRNLVCSSSFRSLSRLSRPTQPTSR